MPHPTHRFMIAIVFLLTCRLWLTFAYSQTPPPPKEKIDLKILYAGTPNSPRESEFRDFLRDYFKQVDTTDVTKLQAKDVEPYDVLLVDAQPKERTDADPFGVPKLTLPDKFSKPTVSISVIGSFFTGSRGLKTGYL